MRFGVLYIIHTFSNVTSASASTVICRFFDVVPSPLIVVLPLTVSWLSVTVARSISVGACSTLMVIVCTCPTVMGTSASSVTCTKLFPSLLTRKVLAASKCPSNGDRFFVFPIEGSFGSPCRAVVGIGGGFTIKTDTNGIACFELAAHPICLVFADPRPRLFAHLCREADAAYLQWIFAFGQRRAVLCQFVLRTGGEQQCRHEAIH